MPESGWNRCKNEAATLTQQIGSLRKEGDQHDRSLTATEVPHYDSRFDRCSFSNFPKDFSWNAPSSPIGADAAARTGSSFACRPRTAALFSSVGVRKAASG